MSRKINEDVVEEVVNEVFDDCLIRELYKRDCCEVVGYCLNDEEYKFIIMDEKVIIGKKDFMYDVRVLKVCSNENELKEYLKSL